MARDMFRLAYNASMQAGTNDTAELMIYGEIIQDTNQLWKQYFYTENDKCAAELDKEIKQLREDGATKLLVRINSPGGICTEGVAMRSVLANAGFEEINIRIEGLCASAATVIATIGGAHVSICEGSEYMIHRPCGGARGYASDLEIAASRLRNIEKMSRDFYVEKTGQSEKQIQKWVDAETWFTAEQAVEYGFCDEVLKSAGEEPAAASVSSREMETMLGMYQSVPANIAQWDRKKASNAAPAAPENKHNEEEEIMNINEITMEQLMKENPALYAQVQNAAAGAERQRQEDIDALTIPGYEAMAQDAKKNGTSAADFQRQIVAAMRAKGGEFMAQRAQETGPAANVTGGAPSDGGKTEEQLIQENAKAVAGYASDYQSSNGGMY